MENKAIGIVDRVQTKGVMMPYTDNNIYKELSDYLEGYEPPVQEYTFLMGHKMKRAMDRKFRVYAGRGSQMDKFIDSGLIDKMDRNKNRRKKHENRQPNRINRR